MRTYPLHNRPDGTLRGFEINSTWIWIGTILNILKAVPGVSEVKRVYMREERMVFRFHGEPCVVWEPFGDNSRYWIGPESAGSSIADLGPLHQAFVSYQSPLARLLSHVRLSVAG